MAFFIFFVSFSGPVSAELLLTKNFINDPVLPGHTVTLEFTLAVSGGDQVDATGITFTDNLSAVLPGLAAIGLPANNVCGAGSQISGAGVLTFTGGNLAPGTSCTFDVILQVPANAPAGSYVNTTSNVTATSLGLPISASPATDVLQVVALSLTKFFVHDPAAPGGTVPLQFTVANGSAVSSAAGIAFTDDLSAVLPGLVAIGLPVNNVCGAGSQISGTGLLAFSGGSLSPGASCTFIVTLQVPAGVAAGTAFTNTTSPVTGTVGGVATTGNAATDILQIELQPAFGKGFAQGSIVAGWSTTLSFTIDNTASIRSADGIDFTDNLPAGMVIASPANALTTCTGGTLTAVSGTGVIAYSGGGVAAGRSCTVMVDVTAAAAGRYVNTTGNLISSLGTSGTASAAIIVEPLPVFGKGFSPGAITSRGVSTLSFIIDNTAGTNAANGIAFEDHFPSGMVIANQANASTTCIGGTLIAVPGTAVITYSGGAIAAGSACMVRVRVALAEEGTYVNTTGNLTSSLGNSGTASATLLVSAPVAVPTVTETGMIIFMVMAGFGSIYFLRRKGTEV